MKKEDLKEGEIYTFHFNDNKTYIGTVRYSGKDIIDSYISYNNKNFTKVMGNFNCGNSYMYDGIDSCKLASHEQKIWFQQCVKAKKFIPYHDINMSIVETLEIF